MSWTMVDPKSTPGENGKTKTNQDPQVVVVTCEDAAPVKEVADQHPLNNLPCSPNSRAKSPTWRGTSPKHRHLSPNWRKPPTKDRRAASPNWREDMNGRSHSPNTRDDKNGGARSPNWRHSSPNNEIGRSLSPNWRKP